MRSLNHFEPSEFKFPDKINEDLLVALDSIRGVVGYPFHIMSDYRSPEANLAAGGTTNSLHIYGRAIDFVVETQGFDWDHIVWLVTKAVVEYLDVPGWEFEIDASNKHFHLGLYPDARPSRLVVKS